MALDLEQVPSSPALRQRRGQAAAHESTIPWGQVLNESSDELLQCYPHCKTIKIGKRQCIPLDREVSPMDNSKAKKESVSRTELFPLCGKFGLWITSLWHYMPDTSREGRGGGVCPDCSGRGVACRPGPNSGAQRRFFVRP